MATSSSAITFSGSSSYSSAFQQVLNRAVQIASLPLTQMQNNVSDLQNQQATLSSLEATFSSLQNSIQNINASLQNSLGATSSNSSAVSASAVSTALPGTYSIQVDDPGSSTTTLSKAGLTTVTDPTSGNITSSTSFTLTINGTNTTITPSDGSLESLANAINDSGAAVQATIINLGSTSSPDYRLALTSSDLGADAIQLTDSNNNSLLDTLQTGTNAQYKVNGMGTDIQSTSRQVTLAPGLTVNLLQQTSSPVTINVSNNFNALQNALSNFATAYNSAVDALAQQRGQNAGALAGNSIVYQLQNTLSSISQYSGTSGTVTSLANLGLNLDETGHLSFNASAFSSINTSDVSGFLGSTTTGGFLQAANNSLSTVADSTDGSIMGSINTVQDQINNENDQISQEQSRITDLQNNLTQQLSDADAAIATLESQKTYFTDLFQAEYTNNNSSSSSGG